MTRYERFQRAHRLMGYPFDGIVIGAVRNSVPAVDEFNDWLYCCYTDSKGTEWCFEAAVTTDPGSTYMVKPMHPDGAAFIAAGHYPLLWKRLTWHGARCLWQQRPVRYYRDNTRDLHVDLDPATLTLGAIGLMIHPHFQGREEAARVLNSSAGCTVFQRNRDHAEFMRIIDASDVNEFSHTMWEQKDFQDLLK